MKQKSRYSLLKEELEEVKRRVETLEDIQHNICVDGAVKNYRNNLIENATEAELKFKRIAELKHLKLEFQYRIDYLTHNGTRIKKVYYADFCDTRNKLIFEIDGKYHEDKHQVALDLKRTRALCKMGYKVFRITNEEIFSGKTSAFLYRAYLSIGIDISKVK